MSRDDLVHRLVALTRDPSRAAVLCDVDGTLAPIVQDPREARVPAAVTRTLESLAARYAVVGCVSGRRAADARRLVGVDGIVYAGLHGAEVLEPGSDDVELVPAVAAWQGRVHDFAAAHDTPALRALGVTLEHKGPIVAFHWRQADDDRAAAASLREVAAAAAASGFATHWGRKVLELRPPVPIDKGAAVRRLVDTSRVAVALFGGDDATDLDAFRALDELVAAGALSDAVRVGVRSEEGPDEITARADLVVDGPAGFAEVLDALVAES